MHTTHHAYIIGDNICTDLIHPPDYFSLDKARREKGFLRGISAAWADSIAPGAIIIGGDNFGCGSSREVTAQVFHDRGVALVLARSFARIFYRNMVNLGIPVCRFHGAHPWQHGQELLVEHDPQACLISSGQASLVYEPPPLFIRHLVAKGGLLASIDTLFDHAV
jgi:3-isopropylmalate dehydratase small subunit